MVVNPALAGSKAWDEFSPLFDIQQVLEDVKHHGDKVKATAIDNPQFSTRRWDLLPKATVPPSKGHEHEDDTPTGQLSHGNPSLTATSAHDDLSPHAGRILVA
jgi:hypothetical protein